MSHFLSLILSPNEGVVVHFHHTTKEKYAIIGLEEKYEKSSEKETLRGQGKKNKYWGNRKKEEKKFPKN